MAETYRNLSQLNPDPDTLTELLAVTGNSEVVLSVVCICNTTGTEITFRLAHVKGGANADADRAQYLYYDLPLAANDTFEAMKGLTVGSGDKLFARASAANVAFNVYGARVTPS